MTSTATIESKTTSKLISSASTAHTTDFNQDEPKPMMISVRLTTKSNRYSIPNAKYMIPSDWKRFQLSELINKVLQNSQPVPFDFVIQDQLLRTSLKNFIDNYGLSTESFIEIEYLESVLPPKFIHNFQHDDWISELSISKQGTFLTGSYDCKLRLFSATDSNKPILTISAHQQAILSTTWIDDSQRDFPRIVSGGMDRVIKVWDISAGSKVDSMESSIESGLEGSDYSYKNTHVLPLHKSPVSTIESRQTDRVNATQVLTGDWHGLLALWDLTSSHGDREMERELVELSDGDPRRMKKRKRNLDHDNSSVVGGGGAKGNLVISKEPIQTIQAHQSQVSRGLFCPFDPSKIFTASHDHTVKRFDLETGNEDWSKSTGPEKCPLDLDLSLARQGLLITGSMDRTISLWDSRDYTHNVSLEIYGHGGAVSSLSIKEGSGSGIEILSGSYDGSCKIWDTRSTKRSLYTIQSPSSPTLSSHSNSILKSSPNKILSVSWSQDSPLFAFGGQNRVLSIHSL